MSLSVCYHWVMQKALSKYEKQVLLLSSPVTEVAPFQFIYNAVCSVRGFDFIIFDDIKAEEDRYVQFFYGMDGLVLDFNAVPANDHDLYLDDIQKLLNRLGFEEELIDEPNKYFILHVPGQNGETTIRANFGYNAILITKFVFLVFDVLFESDVRKARVILDTFPDMEEAKERGLTVAPKLVT